MHVCSHQRPTKGFATVISDAPQHEHRRVAAGYAAAAAATLCCEAGSGQRLEAAATLLAGSLRPPARRSVHLIPLATSMAKTLKSE